LWCGCACLWLIFMFQREFVYLVWRVRMRSRRTEGPFTRNIIFVSRRAVRQHPTQLGSILYDRTLSCDTICQQNRVLCKYPLKNAVCDDCRYIWWVGKWK
jgi:hypothetical protein